MLKLHYLTISKKIHSKSNLKPLAEASQFSNLDQKMCSLIQDFPFSRKKHTQNNILSRKKTY